MNEAFHLARLQKLDTQVDLIDSRLAEIQAVLDNDTHVQTAQSVHAAADQKLREARKELKAAEESVQRQRVKIDLNQSALYGGRVRNPKELQDLQNESAALARHFSVLEDKQLEAMLALEDAEKVFAASATLLDQAQAAFATRSAAMVGERSRLQKDRERLLAEREQAASQIAPNYLDIYARLRQQKRGVAVAGIEDSSCTVCGSELPPMDWQAARSPNKVVYCAFCGRILYAG